MKAIFVFLLLFLSCLCYSQFTAKNKLETKNAIYASGVKWMDASSDTLHKNKYEHTIDFYVAGFNKEGKNIWQKVFDKGCNFSRSSELIERGDFIYGMYETSCENNRAGEGFRTSFLLKMDSVGNIVNEKKLDSTFYGYSSFFFANDFIFILFYSDKLKLVKYNYDFELVENVTDSITMQFLYESKVFTTKKGYLAIGKFENLKQVNNKINTRMLGYEFQKPNQVFVKRLDTLSIQHGKMYLTPLPLNEIYQQSVWFQNNSLYFLTSIQNQKKLVNKIYRFDGMKNKLEIVSGGISNNILYFSEAKNGACLYITYREVIFDEREKKVKINPYTLYFIKNGKIMLQYGFKELDNLKSTYFFEFKPDRNAIQILCLNSISNSMEIKYFNLSTSKFEK